MSAISAGDLLILRGNRSDGSRKILPPRGYFVSVETQVEQYAGQVNGAPLTDAQTFGIYQVAIDNTSGSSANTLPHMTVDFGSTPGANDLGQARLRLAATSTALYLSEMSPAALRISDNSYFSVKRTWRPWLVLPRGVGSSTGGASYTNAITMFVDYNVAYSDQNANIASKANITRSATVPFAPKPAGFVDGYHTASPQTYRTMVLSGALSLYPGSSNSAYLWNVGDGTITVGTTASATITVRFPVGFRWISLTVTAANGKTGVMYFPIWVHNAANMPLSRVHASSRTSDWRETELEFFQQDTSETVIKKGAVICCWEDDPFWGETVPDQYRDQFLGWNKEDATLFKKYDSRNTLMVTGLAEWLSRFRAIPMRVYDPGTSPTTWFEMQNITNDKLAYYLLQHFSTAFLVGNLYLSGNTDRIKSLDLTGNSLFGQEQYAVLGYQGKARCDSLNQIWLRKHYPYLTLAERALRDKTMSITQADRPENSPLKLSRRQYFAVASVLGAGGTFNGTTQTIYNSRAPGRTPYDSNSEQDAPGLNLPTTDPQTVLNWMTGQHLGVLNNANESVPYSMLPNLDCAEPAWDEAIQVTDITPDSGYTVSNKEFLTKEIAVTYDYSGEGSRKRIDYTLTEVTTGETGQMVEVIEDTTDPPDYEPPADIIPFPINAPVDYLHPPQGYARIAILITKAAGSASLGVTSTFDQSSPTWVENALTLDGGELMHDGIPNPNNPTHWECATSTKLRVYENVIASPSVLYSNAFTYAVQTAVVQTYRSIQHERTAGNANWIPVLYYAAGRGLVYEGSINGGSSLQSPVDIGDSFNYSQGGGAGTFHRMYPPLYVDPTTDGVAYTIARDGGSLYKLFKTSNFGASWAVSTEYPVGKDDGGAGNPTLWKTSTYLGRPYQTTAFILFNQVTDISAANSPQALKGIASTGDVQASVHHTPAIFDEWVFNAGVGAYAAQFGRRMFQTCDTDINKYLLLSSVDAGFGGTNTHGIGKVLDGSTIIDVVPHANYSAGNWWMGGVIGGDGKAVYLWGETHSGATDNPPIGYINNIDTASSVSDLKIKKGTGLPAVAEILNLGGW